MNTVGFGEVCCPPEYFQSFIRFIKAVCSYLLLRWAPAQVKMLMISGNKIPNLQKHNNNVKLIFRAIYRHLCHDCVCEWAKIWSQWNMFREKPDKHIKKIDKRKWNANLRQVKESIGCTVPYWIVKAHAALCLQCVKLFFLNFKSDLNKKKTKKRN